MTLRFRRRLETRAQINTPEFKRWFGKSKVVDADGQPLRVYHGSDAAGDIEEFLDDFLGIGNDQYGAGFYFTDKPEAASAYASNVSDRPSKNNGGVVPVYLRIENPIVLGVEDNLVDGVEITARQALAVIKSAPNLYDLDTSPIGNHVDVWSAGKVTDAMVRQVAKIYTNPEHIRGDFFDGHTAKFLAAFQQATGYDGVIKRTNDGDIYVVFNGRQVKSATGNSGKFDPKSSKMTEAPEGVSIDYRADHRPPGPEDGAPGYDLTLNGVYPDDFYGPRGAIEYGHDNQALASRVRSWHDDPDRLVWIYRAVPEGASTETVRAFRPGDWVTIDKDYAHEHGEGNLGNKYKIARKRCKTSEIFTNGDSLEEWGYWPHWAERDVATEASSATQDDVDQFERDVLSANPGLAKFSLFLTSQGDLHLNMIAVDRGQRKSGVGTRAMQALCDFADKHGLRITLITGLRDERWGTTSKTRLVAFYKRFGFVENKGRNKDFSISDNMYRNPAGKATEAAQPDGLELLRSSAGLISSTDVFGRPLGNGLTSRSKMYPPKNEFTIRVKPSQLRPTQPEVNAPAVRKLAAQKGSSTPPEVMVGHDSQGRLEYQILDGHHRAAAAVLRGDKTIEVRVTAEDGSLDAKRRVRAEVEQDIEQEIIRFS